MGPLKRGAPVRPNMFEHSFIRRCCYLLNNFSQDERLSRVADKPVGVNADGASEEATWLALHSKGGVLQRALSCDSVSSESSVNGLDIADDVSNKIGQLEFSVQYLRYADALSIAFFAKYRPS